MKQSRQSPSSTRHTIKLCLRTSRQSSLTSLSSSSGWHPRGGPAVAARSAADGDSRILGIHMVVPMNAAWHDVARTSKPRALFISCSILFSCFAQSLQSFPPGLARFPCSLAAWDVTRDCKRRGCHAGALGTSPPHMSAQHHGSLAASDRVGELSLQPCLRPHF